MDFSRGITALYLRQILAFRPKGKDKISERISRMYFRDNLLIYNNINKKAAK